MPSPKCSFPFGYLGLHLIHGSSDPHESVFRTASRSVQPFRRAHYHEQQTQTTLHHDVCSNGPLCLKRRRRAETYLLTSFQCLWSYDLMMLYKLVYLYIITSETTVWDENEIVTRDLVALHHVVYFRVHAHPLASCTHIHTRSTQPCIPLGSLNRVPASAGVRAGMSPLPGGR